jgi:CheY-like chemotaxis protein
MMLQMFGRKAQAAYNGQGGLEMALEYQPEVVLLDIGLPDMNGYEVAQRLRQQPQNTKYEVDCLDRVRARLRP